MYAYPEAVQTIVRDYLDRVSAQLRTLPPAEREEFLRELESHIYEGYHAAPDQEPVARILTVLRRLGEPAEVVSGRLPESMVRSGTKRKLPMRLVAGLLIALFGLPLGFGGVAVVAGMLVALAGTVFAYYAMTAAVLLSGAVFLAAGLIRINASETWDSLVAIGFMHFDGPLGDYLSELPAPTEGLLFLMAGAALVVAGLGLLWLGKHMLRGTRFLFNLAFDGLRRGAEAVRRQFAGAPNRARTSPLGRPAPHASA